MKSAYKEKSFEYEILNKGWSNQINNQKIERTYS